MPKFRKKPVVIEAVQFDGTDRSYHDIQALADASKLGILETCEQGIQIRTLEGVMVAVPGDFVIRGIKGELYPCRADIFAATYEPAGDA